VHAAVRAGDTTLETLVGSSPLNLRRHAAGLPPVRPKVILRRLEFVFAELHPHCGDQSPGVAGPEALQRTLELPALQRLNSILRLSWFLADKDRILRVDDTQPSVADAVGWWCLHRLLCRLPEGASLPVSAALPFLASWYNRLGHSPLLQRTAVVPLLFAHADEDPTGQHLAQDLRSLPAVLDSLEGLAEAEFIHGLPEWRPIVPRPLDWGALPASLDPANGCVGPAKAARKRAHIHAV